LSSENAGNGRKCLRSRGPEGAIAAGLYGIYETYELKGAKVWTSSSSSGTPNLIRLESPNLEEVADERELVPTGRSSRSSFKAPWVMGLGSSTDCLKATGLYSCLGCRSDLGLAMGYLNDLVQSCPGSQ
jgi:hypothetical protein